MVSWAAYAVCPCRHQIAVQLHPAAALWQGSPVTPLLARSYVVAAAQAGRHNEKRESYGHSLIVDPWGAVVGRLEDPQATGIAVAEVDLAALADIRARMPVAAHRALGRPCLRPQEESAEVAAAAAGAAGQREQQLRRRQEDGQHG